MKALSIFPYAGFRAFWAQLPTKQTAMCASSHTHFSSIPKYSYLCSNQQRNICLLACGTQVRAFEKRDETTESEPSYLQRTSLSLSAAGLNLNAAGPKLIQYTIRTRYRHPRILTLHQILQDGSFVHRCAIYCRKAKVEVCAFRQLLYKPN